MPLTTHSGIVPEGQGMRLANLEFRGRQPSTFARFAHQRGHGGQAVTANPPRKAGRSGASDRQVSCGIAFGKRFTIGKHQLLDLGFVSVLSGFLDTNIPPSGEVVVGKGGKKLGHWSVSRFDAPHIGPMALTVNGEMQEAKAA